MRGLVLVVGGSVSDRTCRCQRSEQECERVALVIKDTRLPALQIRGTITEGESRLSCVNLLDCPYFFNEVQTKDLGYIYDSCRWESKRLCV